MNSTSLYIIGAIFATIGVAVGCLAYAAQQREQASGQKEIITHFESTWREQEQLKDPIFGPISWICQLARDVKVVDVNGQRRGDIWGFPTVQNAIFRPGKETQTLIARFDISNPNRVAIKIISAGITVRKKLPSVLEQVGEGEMVSGGKLRNYECQISSSERSYDGKLTDKTIDFVTIDAHGLEAVEICVRGDSEGLFLVSPNLKYILGSSEKFIELNSAREVAFFARAPKEYESASKTDGSE